MKFPALLKKLRRQFTSTREFAKALDVDPSHLSRAMGKNAQPFDVRGCLRLARVTKADPGVVLRASGKDEIADLIEELYGPAATVRLTPEQRQFIECLELVTDAKVRRSVLEVVRGVARGSAVTPPLAVVQHPFLREA